MSRTGTAVPELRLQGRGASGGFARGRIHVRRSPQDSRSEAAAAVDLPTAVRIALSELRRLQQTADDTAAEILQFQVELLNDPELIAGALDAIEKGEPPAAAFRAAMQEHLRVYEEASSEYLRERAADVRDLRDRVLRAFSGERQFAPETLKEDCLLLVDDLTPSGFVELDLRHIKGVATRGGSPMSHVAMLARARGTPLVVGLRGIEPELHGREALLDGDTGCLLVNPSESSLRAYRLREAARTARAHEERLQASEPAVTPEGRRIAVYLNVDAVASLDQAPSEWFDGIGLARTELLFDCSSGVPDEATQTAVYARLFEWCAGRPATIRLFDAGGDKPVPGLTAQSEANPFLGVRGVRALLRHRDVLRAQLRAIVKASAGRTTRILVPMVTIPEEMADVRAELRDVLRGSSVEGNAIRLGMMVETPAAALTIERFDASEFFAIGTNDLLQYLMAASRDSTELEYLHAPTTPALLAVVRRIVMRTQRSGREVCVCGDAAADLEGLRALIQAGVSAVSVPAHRAPAVKAAIRAGAAGR